MSNRVNRFSLIFYSGLFWITIIYLAGCRRSDLTTAQREGVRSRLSETIDWADKRRQGIDFIAVGTNPAATTVGWRLDVDFSRQMLFQSFDGPDLLMPMPKPQPTGKGLGVLLDSKAAPAYASTNRRTSRSSSTAPKTNRLKVYIEPVACRDPATKRDYAYTVRVEANGKRYTGCGSFIKGSDRLNGGWILETFKGQRLRPDQFGDKSLPVLYIDLASNKLTGSTGWNKLRGAIHADGDHLTIDPKPASHKTASGKFETDFLETLRQSSLFRIGKDRLTLLVDGQYAMTLRKQ